MRMKVHRHELEDVAVLLDTAPESLATFVGSEGDSSDGTARVVNRHGKAAADPELRCLVEECALWLRETGRGKFSPPLEGLRRCKSVDDDRIEPLIALPQIMVCPFDRVGRDELWRVAPSRRQSEVGEAAQIKRRAGFSENGAETVGIAAGGKAINKS